MPDITTEEISIVEISTGNVQLTVSDLSRALDTLPNGYLIDDIVWQRNGTKIQLKLRRPGVSHKGV